MRKVTKKTIKINKEDVQNLDHSALERYLSQP